VLCFAGRRGDDHARDVVGVMVEVEAVAPVPTNLSGERRWTLLDIRQMLKVGSAATARRHMRVVTYRSIGGRWDECELARGVGNRIPILVEAGLGSETGGRAVARRDVDSLDVCLKLDGAEGGKGHRVGKPLQAHGVGDEGPFQWGRQEVVGCGDPELSYGLQHQHGWDPGRPSQYGGVSRGQFDGESCPALSSAGGTHEHLRRGALV